MTLKKTRDAFTREYKCHPLQNFLGRRYFETPTATLTIFQVRKQVRVAECFRLRSQFGCTCKKGGFLTMQSQNSAPQEGWELVGRVCLCPPWALCGAIFSFYMRKESEKRMNMCITESLSQKLKVNVENKSTIIQ